MMRLLVLLICLWAGLEAARAEDKSFDVLEYVIEGNSVLPVDQIETTVYPFLGEHKTIKDVEQARLALEKAYHEGGYLTVYVDIPEQEVKSGEVRLHVTEAKVERLRVTGSRYYSLGAIKAANSELAEGSVPYFPEVEKQLAQVNRNDDRRVTPVLRPGRTPGKVEVDLKVEDKPPLHGDVEVNDRYSADTTHTRFSANLSYGNLWQRDHSLSLIYQVAPENASESQVLSATYSMPLASGNYLAAYAVHSESNVAALGDVTSIGKGNIYGLRYILPLRFRPGYFHSLTLGMDYKDFAQTTSLSGGNDIEEPISYLPFSIAYDATLQGKTSLTQMNATLNFSVRGLADGDIVCVPAQNGNPAYITNEFACKRYGAQADYAYLRLDLKHTRRIAAGWSLFARMSGQLAGVPLISNEQFAAGGVDSVRGYLESNSLGDDGLQGSVELRTPSYAKQLSSRLDEFVPYAFVEGATLRVRDTDLLVPRPVSRYDLLSAGLGLRFKGWGGVNGSLVFAHPFRDAGPVMAGDDRVHFSLGYHW